MLSFEPRSLQTSGRVRRCLVLVAVLYASLWLINLVPPWKGPAGDWLRKVGDVRGCLAECNVQSSIRVASADHSSLSRQGPYPVIGKVTMFYGDPNPAYDRALASHHAHAIRHGYPTFTLKRPLLNGVWSKLAYLMSVVSSELQKPPEEQLKWLFWFDADTFILNDNVKLETFLPPANDAAFANVSFLIASDQRGPQAGVFYLRVSSWTLELLSAAIALPRYRPDLDLTFAEQTALECLTSPPTTLHDVLAPLSGWGDADHFKRQRVRIPQGWADAHVGTRLGNGKHMRDSEGNPQILTGFTEVEPGDLLVHFSGLPDKSERMMAFLDEVERHPEVWVMPFDKTGLKEEADEFWQSWKARHSRSL